MLHAGHITRLQDDATVHGHDDSLAPPAMANDFDQLIVHQHMANFDLWHQEDLARDPYASDRAIVDVKHNIDALNQLRNDLAEQIDLKLLAACRQNDAAPLHSESPGLIIDRLSILALKIFHTSEERGRPKASDKHAARAAVRLKTLQTQRDDLASCLDELWHEVLARRRRFKLYRQMKMYNDPDLNPVLYRAKAR